MKLLVLLLAVPALCFGQQTGQWGQTGGTGQWGQTGGTGQFGQTGGTGQQTPTDAKCKGSWFLIGQQCFKMMPRALKWADAELMCEQNAPCGVPVLGGVMSLTDVQTSNAVVNHLKSLSSTPMRIDVPFWTGLQNKWNQVLEQYEGWKWPSGYSTTQQPLRFVNWAVGEPNNQLLDQQHSYCAAMNGQGLWYVVRCDEPMYFMCSMPVNPPLQGTGRSAIGPGMLMETPHRIVGNHIELENGLLMRKDVGGL